MAKVKNFSGLGSLIMSTQTAAVGDTVFGVTIDGWVKYGRDLLPNNLEGSKANDYLVGGSRQDVLAGGDGDDVMTGGGGADLFKFRSGHDVITDFSPGDELKIRGLSEGLVGVRLLDAGADTLIQLSSGDSIKLLGVHMDELWATSTGYEHV